nr:immunoglobulin light chain junction region [Macaca mulatta]MOY14929.1 immunoglobulin light chain junction region [Macaca mulatta]MOY15275.1 immunoglobulin light chain junction region [Macaca mulatta]MOY15687.1 immunoglobulin light chain junction region [Macaca mulatta]MOY15865.1 immunoglobulin light chain junction region [Macaca mulatta]
DYYCQSADDRYSDVF